MALEHIFIFMCMCMCMCIHIYVCVSFIQTVNAQKEDLTKPKRKSYGTKGPCEVFNLPTALFIPMLLRPPNKRSLYEFLRIYQENSASKSCTSLFVWCSKFKKTFYKILHYHIHRKLVKRYLCNAFPPKLLNIYIKPIPQDCRAVIPACVSDINGSLHGLCIPATNAVRASFFRHELQSFIKPRICNISLKPSGGLIAAGWPHYLFFLSDLLLAYVKLW